MKASLFDLVERAAWTFLQAFVAVLAVTPLDNAIDVDLYLPGCPPHPAFVFDALLAILEGRSPRTATGESVCARCKRRMEKTDVDRIKKNSEGVPDINGTNTKTVILGITEIKLVPYWLFKALQSFIPAILAIA